LPSPARSSPQPNNSNKDTHIDTHSISSDLSDPAANSEELIGGTDYAESIRSFESKSSSFKAGSLRKRRSSRSRANSLSVKSEDEERPRTAKQADWGIGDEARMGLE